MKKTCLLFTLLVITGCACCGATLSPREQLLQRLQHISERGLMYGHQDDPFYGITWQWDNDRSDTKELCGDYPAVMGFDLGGIELASAYNLDSVPFARMRYEIQSHHRRGGIITLSWHPRNPWLGSSAWIERDTVAYNATVAGLSQLNNAALIPLVSNPKNTVKSVLPGGCEHDKYLLWLCRVADFLVSLTDDKGAPIPIIFRPYHENNGSWFWWGQQLCSDDEYHALWDMTQDYLLTRLPESIVWAFSPNLYGSWSADAWLTRYPGDDRIDIIGEDAYQWGTEEEYITALTADLDVLATIAKEHGKLLAMTECGYVNSPDATWWTRVFRPIVEQYDILYFLPWRNWHKEHFGASPDAETAADFAAWAQTDHVLLLNDIKKLR